MNLNENKNQRGRNIVVSQSSGSRIFQRSWEYWHSKLHINASIWEEDPEAGTLSSFLSLLFCAPEGTILKGQKSDPHIFS